MSASSGTLSRPSKAAGEEPVRAGAEDTASGWTTAGSEGGKTAGGSHVPAPIGVRCRADVVEGITLDCCSVEPVPMPIPSPSPCLLWLLPAFKTSSSSLALPLRPYRRGEEEP